MESNMIILDQRLSWLDILKSLISHFTFWVALIGLSMLFSHFVFEDKGLIYFALGSLLLGFTLSVFHVAFKVVELANRIGYVRAKTFLTIAFMLAVFLVMLIGINVAGVAYS